MDHADAVRQKATERYLLNELDPKERDQFEEHLFDCPDCALDLRAAAMLVEQSKVVLAESPVASPVYEAAPAKPTWFAWFRPAFAAPVLALLLAVVAYQNLVQVPHLEMAANQPQVVSPVSVNFSTRGANVTHLKLQPGEGFALSFSVVSLPQEGIASYAAELYNPAGKVQWSETIPKAVAEEGLQISVPGRSVQPGSYKLAVRGLTASGESAKDDSTKTNETKIDPETIDVEIGQ